jgi:hypothetical protein
MLLCTQMSCSIISDLEIILIRLVVIYYVIRSVLLFLYVSYIVTSERCLTKHAHIAKVNVNKKRILD